jgi:four helix bundle protein
MNKIDLKPRTMMFALRIIEFVESLPKGRTSDVIGRQLLRAGTSVGSNYRSACRAKSQADFIAKMGIVEEADECMYWMELLVQSKIVASEQIESLLKEADEILAITVSSIKTAKRNKQ